MEQPVLARAEPSPQLISAWYRHTERWSLSARFLGTSAARPTVERNVSSIALAREGETMLFECGEGTQRQMMRYGVGFNINHIFFTHFHADHYLGVIGLIRTFGLQGRTDPLHLYGPTGARRVLGRAVEAHDMPAVRQVVRDAEEHDYSISSIVKGIIASEQFQKMSTPAEDLQVATNTAVQ